MSEQQNTSYGADQIKVLDGLEAVRKRPSMYIGNTAEEGLHHLIYEVVDNSIDEALAGYCNQIKVILLEDGSCSVEDNGRGIPVDKHPTENMTALELVLTTLHAGGKFDHSSYKVSGGLHGVGVSVVNALSTHVTAEVRRNGKLYRQTFSYGAKTSELEVVGTSEHTGTTITFKPDPEIFTQTVVFKYEIVLNRLRELAFLNRGVHITLKDEQSGAEDVFHYEGGVVEYVEHLNRNRTPIHPQPIFLEGEQEQVQVEVCLQYVDSYTERLASFVNNINTREGGSHVAGFRAALTKCINKYATDDIVPKHMKEKMEGDDVREGLTAIISVRVPNPQFEGQTKTKLGNSEVKGIVASICTEQLGDYLERNPQVARQILSKAVEAARAREAARKARDLSRKKDGISLLMAGKLAECQSKNPAERELFLVEGDSAGGCFSGETKVALADGRALSFLELIAEQEQGKEHFCYTIQADGKIGLERILHPRLTKRQQEVVQVTLDNGEQIVCTPDHRFLLRDGSYCPAERLTVGTSLMPLYRKLSDMNEPGITIDGYEMVWEPNASRWKFTHVLADKYNCKAGGYQAEDGEHRHHLDFNKRNNNPSNIRRLPAEEHLRLHRQHADRTLRRPDVIEKSRAVRQSPEFRTKMSQRMMQLRQQLSERAQVQWDDAAYKAFMADKWREFYRSNAEYRQQNAALLNEAQKIYWQDEENRLAQAERVRSYFEEHPEARAEQSRKAKEQWSDAELLAWRSQKTQQQWTAEFRARRQAALQQTYYRKTLAVLKRHELRPGAVDLEGYRQHRIATKDKSLLRFDTFCQRYFDNNTERALEAVSNYNHRVVSVEKLTERIDVYDIEVPNTHNFALASGVFVHNSAKQGRDRSIQAILPLRGKIMNVEKARFDKILDSEEIKQLIAAMGTGIGREEFDASKLRYHKIIIMTDADVDGAHIRTLLLTFFYRQMLPLVEQGYVYIGQPPLYRLGRGKKEQYFLDEDALNNHLYDQAAQFVQVRLENGSVLAGQELVSLLKKLTLFERISTFLERMNIQEQLTLFLLENDVHSADQFKEEAFLHGLLDKLASINAVTSGIRVCASRPSCFEAEAAFQGLAHTRAVIGPHIPLIPEYRLGLDLYPEIREHIGSSFTLCKNAASGQEKEIPAKNWRELIRVVREETFRGSHLQRYKGLGEMNPEQLWETTMNPANRTLLRVRIEDAEAADDLFVTLMGDKVEPRREFIQNHALEVSELDV
ncbi:DNA topoisomerase (ATP-hydrolyzing) subunit B [Candidatus Electronema sp. JM]|uniref:DNA topoisomerase (ATP-hydrolyzing) subunit B n=1 Tax=Candidatus Electronema sp. JM TaxID=3401571 RepID=UPI003AA95D8E